MESLKIYEESYSNMQSIRKSVTSNTVVSIDFSKLDVTTAGQLKDAISKVLIERSADVYNVIVNGSK